MDVFRLEERTTRSGLSFWGLRSGSFARERAGILWWIMETEERKEVLNGQGDVLMLCQLQRESSLFNWRVTGEPVHLQRKKCGRRIIKHSNRKLLP